MRRIALLALALSVQGAAWAQMGPIGLKAPETETTEASVAADSFAIIRLFAVMQLSDQQVLQISARLSALGDAVTRAEETENQALLQMRQAVYIAKFIKSCSKRCTSSKPVGLNFWTPSASDRGGISVIIRICTQGSQTFPLRIINDESSGDFLDFVIVILPADNNIAVFHNRDANTLGAFKTVSNLFIGHDNDIRECFHTRL